MRIALRKSTRTLPHTESVRRGLPTPATLGRIAVVVPFIVFLVVYGRAAGHGFISDDFRWILESRVRDFSDARRLFVETTGFYRPVVSLSFAINEWISSTNPRPYGLTNVALALAAALSIAWMVRLLRLPPGAAWFAAGLWLFNFHGISMAVLWISGRTALLLVLFAVLAAVAVLRKRWTLAGAFTLASMLSREEALLLPASLIVLAEFSQPAWRSTWHTRLQVLAPLVGSALVYLTLRSRSDAIVPSNAPDFYRFTFEPATLIRNALEYADRAATLDVFCLLLTVAVVRRLPRFTEEERKAFFAGLFWFAVGYALTIFLPVRSSLYACFPSVGTAIASASIAHSLWRVAPERRRQVLLTAAALLPFMFLPVYTARTDRWTGLSNVSRSVFAELQRNATDTRAILLIDDRSRRANIWSAFGALVPDAVELATDRRQAVWLVPPPDETGSEGTVAVEPHVEAAWMLRDNVLVRTDVSRWVGTHGLLLH